MKLSGLFTFLRSGKSGPCNTFGKDYFDLLFTPEVTEVIVMETNRYADQELNHPPTADALFLILGKGDTARMVVEKRPSINAQNAKFFRCTDCFHAYHTSSN